MVAIAETQATQGQKQQDDPGHHGDHEQAGHAMLSDDAADHDHKRARWAADLDVRAAKE